MRTGYSDRVWGVTGALLCAGAAAAAAWVTARSFDLGWHLEAGKQILALGDVPRVDDFSFTSRGVPWVDHEWLFQVLLHGAWSALGPWGLFLMKTAAAACACAAGFVSMRRQGVGSGLSAAVVVLCAAGTRFRLAERPECATIALAPVCAAILADLARRPDAPRRRILLLGACGTLWINLHAGALLLPILAAASFAAVPIAARFESPRGRLRPRAAVAGAALAVSVGVLLCNPYGYHVFRVPEGIARSLAPGNLVNPEWSAPHPLEFPVLYLVVVIGLAAMVPAIRSGANGAAQVAAMLAASFALALTSVRHVGVAWALVPVLVAWAPMARLSDRPGRAADAAGAVVAFAACVVMILVPPAGGERGVGIPDSRFPRQAVDFIESRFGALEDVRLYNDVRFGGYLIWRGYPHRRVFIDGRNEVHAGLLAEISGALDDGARWQALLARHGAEGAVVSYRGAPVRLSDGTWSTFSETHFPARLWALVYWDDLCLVYVRRDGRLGASGLEREYARVRPEAWRLGLQEREQSGATGADAALLAEIREKLHEDPDCALAKSMASVYGMGE